MKKILTTMTLILIACITFSVMYFPVTVSAEDCLHDPIYPKDWNAEVTTGVRVRDIPCMESSVVLTTLPVGEVVKVIAETDGYYQIRMSNGTEGWVGQWLIGPTDKPFNATEEEIQKGPMYDIVGHKNEAAIRALYNDGIVSGNPDGSFLPDNTLNRAELVKLLIEATVEDFSSISNSYDIACFPDISVGMWYTPYVCYSKEKGIVEGYPDKTFKPEQAIKKVEAVKVILETFEFSIPESATSNPFSDTKVDEWYSKYIQVANEQNLLEVVSGNFYPSNSILRGEVSHIIYESTISK